MLGAGTIVGERYTVKSLVGRGGMGSVYCARDERLGRDVALKVLREDLAADAAERARFIREGQISAQIAHPNVVRTYDAGDDPVGPFLVQEFLTGQTLDQMLPLPPQRAAGILHGIAAALGYIHSRGFVHCDVKPQNILLRDNGTPVLLDFGIARTEGTAATTLIATPHYLAPERATGSAPTAASDLYALGIVLYQAVAGVPPFDAPDVHAIVQMHINRTVPSLTGTDPLLPVLDRIIARLTAKEPNQRYPSAEALQDELAAVERNQVHGQPTIALGPLPASRRSAPASLALPALPAITLPRPADALAAWSAAPAWRRRQWIAIVAVPLILLLLGFSVVRSRRAAPTEPAAQPGTLGEPAATPAQATSIDVPDVRGLQYGAAIQLLSRHGLSGQVGDERSDTAAPGIVLETHPPAATVLPPGEIVVLHISSGANAIAAPQPPAEQAESPTEQAESPVEQAGPPPVDQIVPPSVDQGNDNQGNGRDKDRGKKDKDDKGHKKDKDD
jgi:eukaryotic-like serine/threonine-protein kinase